MNCVRARARARVQLTNAKITLGKRRIRMIGSIFTMTRVSKTARIASRRCIADSSPLSNPLWTISKLGDSPSDLRHPLLLTEHNNFHRDEHYQFTNLLCRVYAESRGRLKSFSDLFPTFSNYESSRGFRRKFRFARRLSCARRWLNCLDMSSDGRKLPSDVRILVLTMSGETSEAPKDRQASQRVRR